MSNVNPNGVAARPHKVVDDSLVKPTWKVLIIGWVIMLLPIPFTGMIGGFIAGFCGFIMAIVNMVRGVVTTGIIQLLCAWIVTAVVYFVSWLMWVDRTLGKLDQAG